jgi:hypothetical protein
MEMDEQSQELRISGLGLLEIAFKREFIVEEQVCKRL